MRARQDLICALTLCLTVFAEASVAAAQGLQTLLHVSPDAEAESRQQLDLEIMDSFGTPVPWGDLHVHHGRKIHVYVVHEELELIQHIHPDDYKNLTAISTTFSVWLTFPLPGVWILHVSFVIRSNHNALGDAVSHVHLVNVSDSTMQSHRRAENKHDGTRSQFGLSSRMSYTDIQTMHEAAGMMRLSASPAQSTLRVVLQPPDGGLWRGQCQRLLFLFEPSNGRSEDVQLVPFLGAAMHAFVAHDPINGNGAEDLIHAHGFPVAMDDSLSMKAEENSADMCSMDMHSMGSSSWKEGFEGGVVMYVRFSEAGPYALFVQVAMRGHVHVARVDVVVQDVLVNMVPFQEAASSRAGVRMSFAELLPDDGREKLSVDQFVRPDRDSPCMTMVNTALTWFGSMCLSACHPDDSNKALKCPIPFPTDGGYHIFTAGNLEAPHLATKQTIPFYSQHHITVNQPAKHAPLQNDHVSRAVNAHASGHRSNFSGGCFSDASDSENDIDVKLIANDGRTVYAGSCVFLELSYERKLEGGTTVEISELQPFMRSAARMLVIPPNQSQADLLMAHSLKQALRHPWDFMGNALQHEDGATLWSQHNPCIKGLKRVASPRVTGDQGGRVGQYFRFPSSGTYSILGHAQDGNVSIISRHSITVCDWKPTGVWSDRCIWNVPPTQYADVVIEEGMDVTLDTEPPPLSSLTVAGQLTISPRLRNIKLSSGTVLIRKNGILRLGTRDQPFDGIFELQLNSSMHEFGPHAVSYLDVHGSLQLWSAGTGSSDSAIPSWTATSIKARSFVLEENPSQTAIESGVLLGIVSSHGEEIVQVKSYSRRQITLKSPLRFSHGTKAIVYHLSHKVRIIGSGASAIRLWNGQPDAGGTVEEKGADFHHHRRLMYLHAAERSVAPSLALGLRSSSSTSRALLQLGSGVSSRSHSVGGITQCAIGYQDTNIYKSSLKQELLAGKVVLHGVEISGLGVSTGSVVQAGLSMTDYACAVRWPEFRKYISLINVSMHSFQAGCIEFHGCTGALEIQKSLCFGSKGDGFVFRPQDILKAPTWRLGIEDSIVHVSTKAQPVRTGRTFMRPPAALVVGNAAMPTGSLTHVLALSVSDSFFLNPLGPAVVWTPAVPGQLHNCEARANLSATARVFAHCQHISNGHGLALAHAAVTSAVRSDADKPSLLESVIAIPTDNSPVQVHGSDAVWATMTWPTDSSLWSRINKPQVEFTGGIPCIPGAFGCSGARNVSRRAVGSWFFNEAVQGPLKPANEEAIEFVLSTKGEGVYGVGLSPVQASRAVTSHEDLQGFQATIAASIKRCTPGHVPVAAESDASPDTVSWTSHGKTRFFQCALPVQVSLNNPTRGFVLSGSALEYFRFDLPEGKRSLFLMVEILYADEPDVMLDFYATRNFLWTKRTPYDIEHVSAFHLPAVQKDADTSIHLPFEVTHVLEYPSWGTFYGVISQGVNNIDSKTEVRITVMATEDLRAYELLKSGKHGIDSVLRSTQHTVATATLTPGQQSMQVGPTCTNGTVRKHFKVQVPTGAQELELSVKPSTGAVFHASHHNWSPSSEMSEFLSENSTGLLALTSQELYGRWGTWFITLTLQSDSLPATGTVDINLKVSKGTCSGNPACSGNGVCLGHPHESRWCKCEPGWYGYLCEIPAASMHGGIHTHLPDQLLLVMDEILGGASSSATIHVEFHAPIAVATAQGDELAQVFSQIFGRDICQSIAVEGSDEMSDERTGRSEVISSQDDTGKMVLDTAGGSEAQQPVTLPSTPGSKSSKSFSTTATPPSSNNKSGGAITENDAERRKPTTTASGNRSQRTDRGDADVAPNTMQTSEMVLILPGAVPELPYGSAVASFMTGAPMTPVKVRQSLVLVTAYLLHVRCANSSDGQQTMPALSAALASQVHHDAGQGPKVHVLPASTHPDPLVSDNWALNSSRLHRNLHGRRADTLDLELLAGVIIDDLSSEQRMVLEDRLADTSVVSQIQKTANLHLHANGISISVLTPGLIVPSVLLAVHCADPEACALDAAQWADSVHSAAEQLHLQQPDDVWAFHTREADLVAVSEDFNSVKLRQQTVFPWYALMLWGCATIACALVALVVYISLSRNRWHQPRSKMWEGYSAVGGPAVAVGEGTCTRSNPLRMSDLSPMSRNSVRIRLTRNSSVLDYYRGIMGYGQLAPTELTWSESTQHASSLMHPLVVCRGTDDYLPGTATMPSLPSGVSVDSQQIRGVARASTTGAMLARQVSTGSSHQSSPTPGTDTETTAKSVRQSLFQLTGRRTIPNGGAEVPELHPSCTPSTDHLPAYKAWMKGGLSTKHGDWLSARRWSVLIRSGEASSLSEAIDLSLSSMTPAALAPPDSALGSASVAIPSSKLAVIAEQPHGMGSSEIEEMHVLHYDVSEAFPRASRHASTTAAPVHLHDDAEAASVGAPSATEGTSARELSSAHDSRWDMDESMVDKGSHSTVDVPSQCASHDAQLREELGICRAGNTAVSCILQARTHQWVSGTSTGDVEPELYSEMSQLTLNCSTPIQADVSTLAHDSAGTM